MKQEAQVTLWRTGVGYLKRGGGMLFLTVGGDRIQKVPCFDVVSCVTVFRDT